MTTRIERYRRLADRCRSIPADHGLREHSVTLVVTAYRSGTIDSPHRDTIRTSILVNGENPKVQWASQKEIALGLMGMGDVKIGPFTPAYPGGGTDRETLLGSQAIGGEKFSVEITGPQHPTGARYRVSRLDVDQAIQAFLYCSPVGQPG